MVVSVSELNLFNGYFKIILILLFLGLRRWSSQLQVPPQIEVQLQILKYTSTSMLNEKRYRNLFRAPVIISCFQKSGPRVSCLVNRVGTLKGPNDIKFILNDQASRSGINQKLVFSNFLGCTVF